ncbi:bifunctional aspartate kinase/homoserine dehydrogenase II [Candidatus Curculioniphilus buchneri]|uniref:bifunctional aspartate kinase/homoserine dehydrogenase II n=1 Tax=Candidatus Curculioniphilus buchneri TaxID=690594 RepID=UPI00376F309A
MSTLVNMKDINSRQLHKFGGSSLSNTECYQRVGNIMAKYSQPGDLMVVSAAGNTTNQLINWLTLSRTNPIIGYQIQQNLQQYQTSLINGLLPPLVAKQLFTIFIKELRQLATIINSVITDAVYAEVVGYGEIWSARLMAALLNQNNIQARWLDARNFLYAERAVQPQIDTNHSWPFLQKILSQHLAKRLVITGFICRNKAGETVLLGRNGSDYSATQIGVLAGVQRITIWSDIAGIYSADPHKVKDAYLLPLLHLDEANELARLAAPVLHARTLQPIFGKNVDLLFRCSYRPEKGCTQIKREKIMSGKRTTIIINHDNVYLIELTILSRNNFSLVHNQVNLVIQYAQMKPLAVGVHRDRCLLQLCYTSETVDNALCIFKKTGLPVRFQLRKSISLIALVGIDVANNPLYIQCLYQQLIGFPIEFFWKAKNGMSLVAVLSTGPTEHLIQKFHSLLFYTTKYANLTLLDKAI